MASQSNATASAGTGRVVERLNAARELLRQLEASRDALRERLSAEDRPDPLQNATGRSSLDNAIETTRGIVRKLEACAEERGETDEQSTRRTIELGRARA